MTEAMENQKLFIGGKRTHFNAATDKTFCSIFPNIMPLFIQGSNPTCAVYIAAKKCLILKLVKSTHFNVQVKTDLLIISY